MLGWITSGGAPFSEPIMMTKMDFCYMHEAMAGTSWTVRPRLGYNI